MRHRIPTCGFLFAEKQLLRHIRRDVTDYYGIPVYELNRIKNGAGYTLSDGTVISNERLTSPADLPRRYAYCADTLCSPHIIEQIRGVDLLFHEATFAQSEQARARETFHSTAIQAAQIARAAAARRLLIGHFSARYENEEILLREAMSVFPHTVLARETMKITIDPVKPFPDASI